jgi:hypothetical protein
VPLLLHISAQDHQELQNLLPAKNREIPREICKAVKNFNIFNPALQTAASASAHVSSLPPHEIPKAIKMIRLIILKNSPKPPCFYKVIKVILPFAHHATCRFAPIFQELQHLQPFAPSTRYPVPNTIKSLNAFASQNHQISRGIRKAVKNFNIVNILPPSCVSIISASGFCPVDSLFLSPRPLRPPRFNPRPFPRPSIGARVQNCKISPEIRKTVNNFNIFSPSKNKHQTVDAPHTFERIFHSLVQISAN